MFRDINLDIGDRVANLILNKPPYNVLDIPMMQEINSALDMVKKNESELNLLVISAQGKAFSAGVDVADHTKEKMVEMLDAFHGIFRRLENIEIVTIAAVSGAALGGGCELAIGCDIIIASDNAKFGQPEIKLAVYPPIAITYLSNIVGLKKAFEIVLLGENFSAAEAKDMGLVNQLYQTTNFESEFNNFINRFKALSGSALKVTKSAFKKVVDFDFEKKLEIAEKIYINELMNLYDANEGIISFLEKRKPLWKHC